MLQEGSKSVLCVVHTGFELGELVGVVVELLDCGVKLGENLLLEEVIGDCSVVHFSMAVEVDERIDSLEGAVCLKADELRHYKLIPIS